MLMGVVDTMMLGHLSAEALAAGGLGHIVTTTFMLFGYGLLSALDPLVAQAHGAGDTGGDRRPPPARPGAGGGGDRAVRPPAARRRALPARHRPAGRGEPRRGGLHARHPLGSPPLLPLRRPAADAAGDERRPPGGGGDRARQPGEPGLQLDPDLRPPGDAGARGAGLGPLDLDRPLGDVPLPAGRGPPPPRPLLAGMADFAAEATALARISPDAPHRPADRRPQHRSSWGSSPWRRC